MASTSSGVLTAIKAALAGVSGMTDRVVVGHAPSGKPAQVPSLYVTLDEVDSRRGASMAMSAW